MGVYTEKVQKAPLALSPDDVLLIPGPSRVRLDEIDTSTRVTRSIKIEVPILSSPMDTVTELDMALALGKMGGLGVLHRNMAVEDAVSAIEMLKSEGLTAAAAVGVRDYEKASRLVDAGVDILVIDAAHGHHINVIEATRRFKRDFDVEIMSGNVVTGGGAEELIQAGADSLRVGLGSGHACTTREITGVGVPLLTAVAWVSDVASSYGVPVVADGGIEKPGDIAKVIAAGADAVMLGYLLAGTDEAPGRVIEVGGKKYKLYRGMGSRGALARGSQRYGEFKRVPEGVEGYVVYRGPVEDVVSTLVNALKQSMGYLGVKSIAELRERARFVRITPAGIFESRPRGLAFLEGDTRWR